MDNGRIEQKIDRIFETLGKQAVILERLTVTVEEHVKRSNLHEDEIKGVKKEIEPIKKDMWKLKGAFGFIMFLCGLASIIELFLWVKR